VARAAAVKQLQVPAAVAAASRRGNLQQTQRTHVYTSVKSLITPVVEPLLLAFRIFCDLPYSARVVLGASDDRVPLIVEGTAEDLICVARQHLQGSTAAGLAGTTQCRLTGMLTTLCCKTLAMLAAKPKAALCDMMKDAA
jgi:hypothetical protein